MGRLRLGHVDADRPLGPVVDVLVREEPDDEEDEENNRHEEEDDEDKEDTEDNEGYSE
jgi:hypothetical protein